MGNLAASLFKIRSNQKKTGGTIIPPPHPPPQQDRLPLVLLEGRLFLFSVVSLPTDAPPTPGETDLGFRRATFWGRAAGVEDTWIRSFCLLRANSATC